MATQLTQQDRIPTPENDLGWKPGDPLPDTVPDFELTPEEQARLDQIAKELEAKYGRLDIDLPGDEPVDDSDWLELDDDDDVLAIGLAASVAGHGGAPSA